jgi:demethylmenaquinone methyltransferase/2-methoxy-6-polyprenyl-1,4-benzoquinol methylase
VRWRACREPRRHGATEKSTRVRHIWDEASLARVRDVPDKARRVQAMFDAIVAGYERVNTITTLGLDRGWRRELVHCLDLPRHGAVLDLACGTGQVLRLVRQELPDARRLVAADFSEAMIREARRRGPGAALFVQADALHLPLADNTFDAVSCVFGVRNFQDPAAGLAEIFRVLRPGGIAGILEFSIPEAAALERLYSFYFRRVLPRLASWLSGDTTGAYAYLQRSVEAFADVDLSGMMRRCGFERACARPLTLGVVHLYSARKPGGPGT